MAKTAEAKTAPSGTKPFSLFEWMLAGRYLRTRRREGFVSVIAGFSFLGIMLGVATLIVVLSVMNGFRKELLDKIVGINGHIFVAPLESPLTDYPEVAARIAAVPGVKRAIPLVEGQAFGSSQYNGSGVLVRGIRPEDLRKIEHIAGNLRQGSLDEFENGEGVAIGRRLADALSLQAGDTFTLITPRGASTPFGTAPRVKGYPVKAIFEIGMSEFDSTFVFMPLTEAQNYFNRQNDEGYCHRWDGGCTIYHERPTPCRLYSCQHDERIWKDFDAMELNQEWIDEHIRDDPSPVEIFMNAYEEG